VPAQQLIHGIMVFLHDLATVIWVGGLVVLAAVVLPSVRSATEKSAARQLMKAVQRRLSALVYPSIVVLVVTGALLAKRETAFVSPFSFSNAYSATLAVKHLLVVLMIGIALTRSAVLGRLEQSPGLERTKATLLLANAGLGVIVLALSAATAVIAS